MKRLSSFTATLGLVVSGATAAAEPADPRLREVAYDPRAVVTVPVKRGVVTLVVLDADEFLQPGACERIRELVQNERALSNPKCVSSAAHYSPIS